MTADPLISPEALAAALKGPAPPLLLDASWTYPGGPKMRADGRIDEAVLFDIDAVADQSNDLPHMLPAADDFARAAARLGVTPGRETVIYDRIGLFSAPRVWWTFRAFGLEAARVLDGGLPAWAAEGLPVSPEPPLAAAPKPAAMPPVAVHAQRIADEADVSALLGQNGAQIVDARSPARFRGEAEEPRPGVRPGRIPGACNLYYRDLLTDDWRMRPPDELRAAFAHAGVHVDRPVTASCGSGVTAAIIVLALAVLGREEAQLYDGSWAEWGRADGPAIETGP